MAGIREGHTETDTRGESRGALRIDTDVFAVLTESEQDSDDETTITRWFDCWRS